MWGERIIRHVHGGIVPGDSNRRPVGQGHYHSHDANENQNSKGHYDHRDDLPPPLVLQQLLLGQIQGETRLLITGHGPTSGALRVVVGALPGTPQGVVPQ